jgi:hypothetical protein
MAYGAFSFDDALTGILSYLAFFSIPMNRRPSKTAATPVVPEPIKGRAPWRRPP